MKRIAVAVIGAGHLGRVHARLLASLPQAELIAVVDPDPQAREEIQKLLPVVTYAHLDQLPRLPVAAVVASPTHTHYQVAQTLLRHGVHLLVEKPLASTVEQAAALVELARSRGCVLAVGHVERFNPAVEAAQEFLQSAWAIWGTRAGTFTGRCLDTDVVLDLMIHDLDLVLAHLDPNPQVLQAQGMELTGCGTDVACAWLTTPEGCQITLTASRVAPEPQRCLHIWSTQGYCHIDLGKRVCQVVRPGPKWEQLHGRIGPLNSREQKLLARHFYPQVLRAQVLDFSRSNPLLEELKDFLRAVRTSEPVRVSGQQGLQALQLAQQVQEKIRLHTLATSAQVEETTLPLWSFAPQWSKRQAG